MLHESPPSPRSRPGTNRALGCGAALVLWVASAFVAAAADRIAAAPRIVALAPHLTEITYAAGAGGQLAAVVRHSDHPSEAAGLPQVGEAARVDIERILALKPDLILAWRSGNPAHDLERLAALGFRVFVSEPQRLADIPRLIETVGALAGTSGVANAAARELTAELDALRLRYGGHRPVRVFYEIWHRPLLTVNGAHMISDIIELCGGRNVFGDARVLTPAVSYEAVLARRPDVVVGGSSAGEPADLARAWARAPVAALRALPVRHVDPDLIQRQSPRIAQGARIVCEHLDAVRRAGRIAAGEP